ncbi:6-phosphogluconolactonase [Bifidobacterium sp.]|jgi:6-phosphogluconolactonase|uniref:6-phosphogluconolactonase n=1 Tax=Bifidobacterium sp. TaxID=41200 RepID=UPI0025BA7AF0|nr:6-phosphogluconolactonase [Bifidobacterium sp.]MCH4209469.1 6-phosphogluconolactonase [Bifidobacterium sp.]MCI1225132.1 6-phosphogluconolactonase [Bifidobacterium sp.]
MAERRLVVYRDSDTIAQAGAQRTLLAIVDTLGTQPAPRRFDLALTGGSDSLKALSYMSSNPLTDIIDWPRVQIWWGDERFVAADDEDRNALQARRRFLDALVDDGRLPAANIHEMPADTRSAEQIAAASDTDNDKLLDAAAQRYEHELTSELGEQPAFDLLILGMGPDGHYASLFPGHTEINIADRLVVGVSHSPKLPPLRLSLTAPLLARSRRTWFFTAGAAKADAIAQVFVKPDNPDYPSSFAAGTDEFIWFANADAAAKALQQ